MFRLVIADKNFSSWSLRPWLVLKMVNEPFEEIPLHLYQPDTQQHILQYSPSGKVPVLFDHHLRIWDSLAICEYLAECYPAAQLWPREPAKRATARAITAEMHSGFNALRQNLPMNVVLQQHDTVRDEATQADIERISAIWQTLRQEHQGNGPFLFGHFTLADAMYAPVVLRFASYGINLPPLAQAYAEHMHALPAMQEWIAGAQAEQDGTQD
ncbi:glutathione S-transferase family protein [Craterilacuibacter sp.]|uniref:glutathione S-transferase family protein n=1 Tax=Craterilacuibacter sp. TaxID=2870909 RepID=UPI003F32ECC2